MSLPAWDEITKSDEWKGLGEPEKTKVFQSYLSDLGKMPEWKSLSSGDRFKVVRRMEVDAGGYKEEPAPGVVNGFLAPTGKAILKVLGSASAIAALAPGVGVRGVIDLINGKSLADVSKTTEETLRPYIDTLDPQERKGLENLMLVMKPIEMSGSGWKGIAELLTTMDPQSATDVIEGKHGGSSVAVPILGTVGEAAGMYGTFKIPSFLKGTAQGAADVASISNLAKLREARVGKPFAEVPVEKSATNIIPTKEAPRTPPVIAPTTEVVPDQTGKYGEPPKGVVATELSRPVVAEKATEGITDIPETQKIATGEIPKAQETQMAQRTESQATELAVEAPKPITEAPKLQQAKGPIGSESGQVSLEPLKNVVNSLEESRSIQGVRDTFVKAGEGLSEGIRSPEKVLGRDPVGKQIYTLLDRADQQKNAFLGTEINALSRELGKIKAGTQQAEKIGKALDGVISPDRLNPQEQKVYGFLKQKFDYLIKQYARREAGDEATYQKILQKVNVKESAAVKIESLSPEQRLQYDTLKKEAAEVRKGRKIEALSKEEAEKYWELRRDMRGVLHEEWLKTLSPGEAKAYDILSRKIKDYLPHLFDKDYLLSEFRSELTMLEKKLTLAEGGTATQYKNRIKELRDAITKMEGGYLVTYAELPKNVRFRFFEKRKGKEGYEFDAVKAYTTYLNGLAKKMFDEPAIRQVSELHKDLDPSLKSYNKWYVKNYMGWEHNKLDSLAGAISSFQWMRTLGLNPRSAIVNMTQRVNTIADVGVKASLEGERLAFTDKGRQLFDSTGIAKEVPNVLLEGTVPEGMEKVRAVVGFLFNQMELGNRKHAFLSGYSRAKTLGKTDAEAVQFGIDTVHKTQFRYGRIGMPKALTHPAGRLAGQFLSYPIKQMEFLADLAKNNPGKLIKYLAIAEGGNYTLKEFAGIDLSNALGIGMNYGEAIDAIKDLSKGEIRGFFRHGKLTFSEGGGLLPSGPGPTLNAAIEIAQKATEGKGLQQLKKELTPVIFNRFRQAVDAIKGKQEQGFPVKNEEGHVMYYLTKKELITRTLGPRTTNETTAQHEYKSGTLLEQERREVLKDITRALLDKDMDTANKLIKQYEIVPSKEMLESEALRRETTRQERQKVGKREEYQLQREGRLY